MYILYNNLYCIQYKPVFNCIQHGWMIQFIEFYSITNDIIENIKPILSDLCITYSLWLICHVCLL